MGKTEYLIARITQQPAYFAGLVVVVNTQSFAAVKLPADRTAALLDDEHGVELLDGDAVPTQLPDGLWRLYMPMVSADHQFPSRKPAPFNA